MQAHCLHSGWVQNCGQVLTLAPQVLHLVSEERGPEADGELGHVDALHPRRCEVPGLVDGHNRRQHAQRLHHRRGPRQIQP